MKKLILTIILVLLAAGIFADSKGEEIALMNYNLKEAEDSYSLLIMALINSNGQQKIRKIEMYSQKTDVGTNSFAEFIEPEDVRGTKFLTIGYTIGDDDQRLYLPAMGRVRKISSSNKGGSFMGSEMNYFDMEDHDYSDFNYQYLRDEVYEGKDCYVVEYYPLDENAPYSKMIHWICKDDYFGYKTECYEKHGSQALLKTIYTVETSIIDGVIMAVKMVIENNITDNKTLFQMNDLRINIDLDDDIFSIQNLEM